MRAMIDIYRLSLPVVVLNIYRRYFEAMNRWRRGEMPRGLQQLCEEAQDESAPLLM